MTVNVKDVRDQLRSSADAAAMLAKGFAAQGDKREAAFHTGRQAAFVTALRLLDELEDETAQNIEDELLGEEALRQGVIGRDPDSTARGL